MFLVGEDLSLIGKIGAAGIDEIDAGQRIFPRDRLRAQMLLDGQREVSPAFDGRIIRDDHHLAPRHAADPGDDARGRELVFV